MKKENLKTKKNSKIINLIKRNNSNISPSYIENIKISNLQNNKDNNISKGEVFSEFIDKKNKLYIEIEEKTNLILKAWHNYIIKDTKSVIVDKFCNIISNKHIQEAAEHGTIYLEYEIRPNNITKKIKGIILPRHVGELFSDLDKCIRKIYDKIKKKYNFNDTINKEYFDISKDWRQLSYDQKITELKEVVTKKIIPALRLNKNDIIVHKIEFDTRIVIRISDELEKKNDGKTNYMIKIEDFFKKHVDKRLELFITEKKDANVLRHLNTPQNV